VFFPLGEKFEPENIDLNIEDIESEEELEENNSKPKQRSLWREFSFLFHRICFVITPYIPLEQIYRNWDEITVKLAESPRQRQLQGNGMFHGR
jgi:hypothetical protein